MQHTFEFIAELVDGKQYKDTYTSKTSRMQKVDKQIRQLLPEMLNIHPAAIIGIKMRKL